MVSTLHLGLQTNYLELKYKLCHFVFFAQSPTYIIIGNHSHYNMLSKYQINTTNKTKIYFILKYCFIIVKYTIIQHNATSIRVVRALDAP